MCRHLAWLGPERPLAEVILDPSHSLFRQSWEPRRQRHGTVNADGFGFGWYEPGGSPEPARYRRAVPIWADGNVPDLARALRSGAVLAAVRDATAGTGQEESAAAPFRAGRWLFSHNGAVPDWRRLPEELGESGGLSPSALLGLEARSDTALLWALVQARLGVGMDAGASGAAPGAAPAVPGAAPAVPGAAPAVPGAAPAVPGAAPAVPGAATAAALGAATAAALGAALADVVAQVAAVRPAARLNLLLTDGTAIAATTWGDTLSYRIDPEDGIRIASEPDDGPDRVTDRATAASDDSPATWHDLPDRTLLTATLATGVHTTPITPADADTTATPTATPTDEDERARAA
ncbi:class II glutamine amidotransferase [Streptomyces boninensis]|uniref:class II glutamine amidotransferase n=1 Tax=Streptomyces boninensis TaxID=2039455 RepID=UPI003B20D87D